MTHLSDLSVQQRRMLTRLDDDWLARFFRDKTEDQREKAIEMLKLMFESNRTGTTG